MTRNASCRTQPGTRVSPSRRFLRLTRLDRLVDPVAERLGWFRDKRRTGLGEPVGGVFAWWRPAKKAASRRGASGCPSGDRAVRRSALDGFGADARGCGGRPSAHAAMPHPRTGISTSNPPTTAVQTSQEPEQRTAVNIWYGWGRANTARPAARAARASAPALQLCRTRAPPGSPVDYPGRSIHRGRSRWPVQPQQRAGVGTAPTAGRQRRPGGGGGGGNVANLPADAPPMSDALGGSPIDPVAPANLPQNDAMVGTGGTAAAGGAPGGKGHGRRTCGQAPTGRTRARKASPASTSQASSQGSSKAAGNSGTGTSGTTQTTPISGISFGSTAPSRAKAARAAQPAARIQQTADHRGDGRCAETDAGDGLGQSDPTNLGQAVTLTATVTSSGGTLLEKSISTMATHPGRAAALASPDGYGASDADWSRRCLPSATV